MKNHLNQIEQSLSQFSTENKMDTHTIYPGMEISFLNLKTEQLSLKHDALDHILEINYCQSGRVGWDTGNGNHFYLGPGDFSIHNMKTCATSTMTLPNEDYQGLMLFIDLKQLENNPPELIANTGISGKLLYDKFGKNTYSTSLPGNEQTQSIFSGFYEQTKNLQPIYWKIKTIELLLYLIKLNISEKKQINEYQAEQIKIVRQIHDLLIANMNERFTIESLSKEYLMNPTTLKTVFKAVYGNSIAAHIKEHRMETAARLLLNTNDSIADIAKQVGYTSQSKFSVAFKEYFNYLPTDYRKNIQHLSHHHDF